MTKESVNLWKSILLPSVAEFKAHLPMEQLLELRADAQKDLTLSDAIPDILDTLVYLYRATERLH